MGSFDCYCAFCSGPLGIGFLKFGSRKAKALRKRRIRVDAQKRKLNGEDVDEDKIEDDDDEEMEDAPTEEDVEVAKDAVLEDDDDDDDYEVSSTSSYSSEDSDSIESTSSDIHTGDIQDVPIPPPEPESEHEDTWSQASDLSGWDSFVAYNAIDETERMHSYEEQTTYDPSILNPEDVKWIDRCRCLGFNADAPGVTKAFISGRGTYNDYGGFDIKKPGRDPNDTGEDQHSCFYSYDPNTLPAFPFHEACFDILAKSLGYDDRSMVNKDVLYTIIAQNLDKYLRAPRLDYGLVQECGQFWECLPGEEYSVSDPGPKPGFEEVLPSMIPATLFDSTTSVDLAHKVRNDPLAVLPYDVLHGIIDRLSVDDTMSLMSASSHVLSSTREVSFWRYMLRRHILRWFWELDTMLVKSILPDTFDHKALFLWVNSVTKPEFGSTGPLVGIANRRRIWTACQPLVPEYQQIAGPNDRAEPEDDEAKTIMDRAVSLHMPMVLYPSPREVRTTSSQFIRSWQEITHQPCDFDTYWNEGGALVGIAATFGTHQRIFGSTEGKAGKTIHIPSDEWISKIQVNVSEVRMFNDRQNRSNRVTALDARPAETAEIRGMMITLTSGTVRHLFSGGRNIRLFTVLPHMHLIGLTGQIAANGVISRLGLLQASRPGEEPATVSYTPMQRRLWAPSVPFNNKGGMSEWPYQIHTFPSSYYPPAEVPSDMCPHEIILWAESPERYQDLSRISCFQVVGGTKQSGDRVWEVPDILAISAEKIQGHGTHVGEIRPVAAQHPDFHKCTNLSELELSKKSKSFDEANMSKFTIDGPGGEMVTEVHVSDDFGAIKLFTNRNRECYWGEEDRNDWFVKRAEQGECIVGLSCCFARLGGWSTSAKLHSHWRLSDLGVVTMRP
ncbi:uncharacterized protein K460DRAFT_386525 [Cucurbitaria berberidis CBS 394.84]|uniref:F-box domain-containing protein n=1 Tax=Cucurbitaria berberidis CBS 394.84 TaxID=1168544 RepID=A0A9P4L9B7_9PLEO|nr:uncharacterized protein K460DRAFT_386525 [Cucurbitaria berberidis CBS 394.84]KAF1846217.1 hypothetical protein K460DRAFT_386525 [Cucurbitaria berberidis CBS 394.84]